MNKNLQENNHYCPNPTDHLPNTCQQCACYTTCEYADDNFRYADLEELRESFVNQQDDWNS